jgi:hypothetical protein
MGVHKRAQEEQGPQDYQHLRLDHSDSQDTIGWKSGAHPMAPQAGIP